MSHIATITTAWQYVNEDGRIHFAVLDGEHERWCSVEPGTALHAFLLPHVKDAVLPPQQSQCTQASAGQ